VGIVKIIRGMFVFISGKNEKSGITKFEGNLKLRIDSREWKQLFAPPPLGRTFCARPYLQESV